MIAYRLWHRIFDILGEEDRSGENPVYTPEGVCRAINGAQAQVHAMMVRLKRGYWETRGALAVAVGAVEVYLPSDCLVIRRMRDTAGVLLFNDDPAAYPRCGMALGHNKLFWDTAATEAETWTLDYVRRVQMARAGTLSTQAAQTAGTYTLTLPTIDSAGTTASRTGMDYAQYDILILGRTGQNGVASIRTNPTSARVVTLTEQFPGGVGASGERYLMVERNWPEEWLEVLAWGAALGSTEGSGVDQAGYGRAVQAALEMAAGRQTQQGGGMVVNPDV